ncbi:MAG: RidA family protein [Thermodesulfobacteriota bacterium]
MAKTIISTDQAPAAIGPYSQAVRAGGLLFCSGQIGLDPATGLVVSGGVAEQAEQALANLVALLAAAGCGPKDVVKTTCFLRDMADFSAFNQVYARHFPGDYPARSCVAAAGLPKDVLVEVEAIALAPGC